MRRTLTWVAALATLAWFLLDAGVRGWQKPSTDFPNYYTAALLARTHQPLRHYYDWTWFQRQMSFAGFGQQLGGYIPQTPLTLVPFVPLSFLPPAEARHVGFVLNCAFLGLACWLISRITRFRLTEIWLLAFLGSFTLRPNFELGQYYVFLLMLLSLAVWCLEGGREWTGGVAIGTAIGLKLYGAPLLLLAVASRKWRVAGGIVLTIVAALAIALSLFGWSDIVYYTTGVLPRALKGETLDPYHLSNGTAATLLRRLFIFEAELNPEPWIDSAGAFYFLGSMFTLSVIVVPAIAARAVSKRTLAWWLVGMLLVSPNTASYTFALLILPVALLLDSSSRRLWPLILPVYVLLTLPLRPLWAPAFPKVWLLLILFIIAGYSELKRIPMRSLTLVFSAIVICSGLIAAAEVRASQGEPWRHFPHAVVESGAIYSDSPQTSRAGLLYESIGGSKYVLRREGKTFSFAGEAFHPTTPEAGGPIYFELVFGQGSRIVRFNEQTQQAETLNTGLRDPREPVISHDGKSIALLSTSALYLFDGINTRQLVSSAHDASFLPDDSGIVYAEDGERNSIKVVDLASAKVRTLLSSSSELASPSISPDLRRLLFTTRLHGNLQVVVRDLSSGRESVSTGGNCNNYTPVWSGSNEVVFASDCRRGLGLPALYRARLDSIFK